MVNKLELKVEQKTLFINDKNIKLSDNFKRTEVNPKISDNPLEKGLELYYYPKKGFSPEDEADKIYLSLKDYNLSDEVEVSSCPETDYIPNQFPAVILMGEFSYKS